MFNKKIDKNTILLCCGDIRVDIQTLSLKQDILNHDNLYLSNQKIL